MEKDQGFSHQAQSFVAPAYFDRSDDVVRRRGVDVAMKGRRKKSSSNIELPLANFERRS